MANSQVRTLVLTEKPLYPPMGGAALRNWQNVNLLKRFGPVGVFCPQFEHKLVDEAPTVPPGLAYWTVSAIRRRTFRQKITSRLQMAVWLMTRTNPLSNMFYCPEVAQELDQALTSFKPDVVVIEEIWLSCYLFVIKRHPCRVVYDAHNAETSLFREIFGSTQKKTLQTKINETTKLAFIAAAEQDLLHQVDQVWACSEQDAEQLQQSSTKPLAISVIPNSVNVEHYHSLCSQEPSLIKSLNLTAHTLIFTASFTYRPNAVAAEWLLQEIYPRLSARYPDCRVLLVGKGPTEQMLVAAKQNSNIIVTGVVPDIRPYLAAASVVVVPLHQGSGTRLKILEAFAGKRPVVSTSKGVEGVNAIDGVHLLIRDRVEDFVEGVCCLWQSPKIGQDLAQSAYELVNATYSWESAGKKLESAFQELLPNSFSSEQLFSNSREG